MAKPAKSEALKKLHRPSRPKGGSGDDGDNTPWRNWPSGDGGPLGRGKCCRPHSKEWKGPDPKMEEDGWRKFMQIRFSLDDGRFDIAPFWIKCAGNCPLGECSWRYQMYRCDTSDDHPYDYILGFRCECKPPPPIGDPAPWRPKEKAVSPKQKPAKPTEEH
ncbi:MAG TPA: hypothetical protein VN541_19180 [Tepidisphaeraceae bacterium]|nr:hypothetical protein [Tepidisphaeraceae bacterium]